MNDYLVEASMYITKATHDGKVMRWAATNSDTDPDSYAEKMSLELYQNFIDNIKNDTPVPEIFRAGVCSDFWDGGMPYVSISHYPDLNGDAVPGEVVQLYVEGDGKKAKLKAKGILYDNPLGHAVWRSLKEDKNKTSDKIRISIGFLDLAHKHGENGTLFVRDSLTATCPDCQNNVGNKIYVKGYLVHLATTRVPVNKRTEMVLEEKSMTKKITRKDDAKSIVGEELADELDAKSKIIRSEALVEMSEVPDAETTDVEEESETPVEAAVEATEEKSDVEVEKMDAANLPYGGAVSMKEAQKIQKSKEEMWAVMDMFSVFQNVVWNIVDRNDVLDKKAAVEKAIGEFQSLLAAKAMVEFGMVERSVSAHPLQVTIDALLSSVDNSLTLKTDINEKLASVNPALQELGTAITDYVGQSVGDEPAPAQNDDVVETIKNLIQPLVDTVSAMRGEIEVLKAKGAVEAVTPSNRIPAPRTHTLPPSLLQKSEPAAKPGSLRSIINKSVGISE